MDLSILVVSYNTRELTLECLRSVHRETHDCSFEVLVVDNGSQDGSAEAVRRELPGVRVFALDENLGFAAANNLAADHATGEYLLLLNPDTVVLDSAIDRLLEFARERPEAGIWGGRTVFADGSLNPASCWRRITLWSTFCEVTGLSSLFRRSAFFDPESMGRWPRDSVREVDIVSGCFFLIRADHWRRLGGFDPGFFMYGEEADLCLRARRVGLRPCITPAATIVHHGGASEPVRSGKLVRLLEARCKLVRRHWNRWTAPLGVRMITLRAGLRAWTWWVLARLGRSNAEESLECWRTVWRRRREWSARAAP